MQLHLQGQGPVGRTNCSLPSGPVAAHAHLSRHDWAAKLLRSLPLHSAQVAGRGLVILIMEQKVQLEKPPVATSASEVMPQIFLWGKIVVFSLKKTAWYGFKFAKNRSKVWYEKRD